MAKVLTKEQQVLQKAIEAYGLRNQLDMLTEEIGELLQAINKAKRNNMVFNDGIRTPATLSIPKTILYHNLCSEVADVKIMLAQLELSLDAESVQTAYDRKLARLEKRMENHKTTYVHCPSQQDSTNAMQYLDTIIKKNKTS